MRTELFRSTAGQAARVMKLLRCQHILHQTLNDIGRKTRETGTPGPSHPWFLAESVVVELNQVCADVDKSFA